MANIKEWLETLVFSQPTYFTLGYVLSGLYLVLALIIAFKIFRPRPTSQSRYRIFGPDARWWAVLAIWGISVVALAGPQNQIMKMTAGGSVDVVILLDATFSTEADDINGQTRLDIMKQAIMQAMKNNSLRAGDRVTLFTFGTNSSWRMPLSEDQDEFKTKLAEVVHPPVYNDDSQLTTNLAVGLEHIPKGLDDQDRFFTGNSQRLGISWVKHSRVVLLFSDGDDREGVDLNTGIDELKKRQIKVYTVGVGTKSGKELTVKAYDPKGSDKPVKLTRRTALRMERLNEISTKTGGGSYALDSASRIDGVQDFIKDAIDSNRDLSPRLVAVGEGKDIWWEFLAIPGVLLLVLMIKWS